MDTLSLSKADVAPRVGETFTIVGEDATVGLRLVGVDELANSSRPGGGFRIEFVGQARDGVLPQATYRFVPGEPAWDIFIVPIGRDGDTVRYEAIFN